jgi:ornithine carbamoyltransferase
VKDLLRASDLTAADLTRLLDLAAAYRQEPRRDADLLRDETVGLYFAKPSTRTRISTATAVAHLGAVPLTLGGNELQLGRGETIEDTAQVISRYCSAFVIRTFDDNDVRAFAEAATIPVVNALTDGHHPLQSLADLLTLRDRFGRLQGLRLAYVGDGNNVTHSLMEAGALAGMTVAVATPEGYEPDATVTAEAQALARQHGGEVLVVRDPREAVAGAHAVYGDVWLSMGDPESETAARFAALEPYRITGALVDALDGDGIVLHCLPAHRGEEIDADVLDGPRSAVFDQAENRLWTAQAVLAALVRRELTGAG